jgi:hypothetical protein
MKGGHAPRNFHLLFKYWHSTCRHAIFEVRMTLPLNMTAMDHEARSVSLYGPSDIFFAPYLALTPLPQCFSQVLQIQIFGPPDYRE